MFDLELCKKYLADENINIMYFESLPSTNEYLKNNLKNPEDFTVAVTTEQTKGRGRFAREWKSGKGQGIAVSLLFKDIDAALISFFSVLSAVCVIKCLKKITGRKFLIKWPNDIVYDNKKICGILCESQITGNSGNVICGVGINVNQNEEFFGENNLLSGGSLFTATQKRYEFEKIVAGLILSYSSICKRLKSGDRKNILSYYMKNCVTLGREIKYDNIRGKAVSVDIDGSLVIERESGERQRITDATVTEQDIYDEN